MGNYEDFDYTKTMTDCIFRDQLAESLDFDKFPGSNNMMVGVPYEWIVPNTYVVKTGVSPDGANILHFGKR
jgi:hypothetical protein